ncbi:MAG: helix-turn-helix transcriptional regulator, partial [Pseudoxanthomonas sp.]
SRAALERSGGLAARLPLAHSLAWQGRGRDADGVLAPVDPEYLSEWDLMAWTLPKAANQFWMLGESEQAIKFLADMRARISEPAALHTIDALDATFAMNAGEPPRAVTLATQVLDSPAAQDLAVAWAAATATLSCARMGRYADVTPLARRGLAAQHPGLLRFVIGLGEITTLLMTGDVDSAEDTAKHYLEFAELQQPGHAIGEVLLAQVLMARGDLGNAISLLRQAAAALTDTGYSWGPLALMCLAQALGQRGNKTAAAAALQRAEAAHGIKSELYAPELSLARAWTLAAARDTHGALSAARDAARIAARGGQATLTLRALHDAVRLGDTHAVEPLTRVGLECEFATMALAHARALAAGDGTALDEVSAVLAQAGMNGTAADAAAQAAVAHAAGDNRKSELKSKARAAELARLCADASTPALERVLNPLPLTGREREIAIMVADGLTNKAIAENLCVSIRTVEGHIYRACTKLDVSDRTMLGHAVRAARGQDG